MPYVVAAVTTVLVIAIAVAVESSLPGTRRIAKTVVFNGPMGVSIAKDEIWVANFGDHTALVFPRLAAGNAAPRRIIRNAPAGRETSGFGNPYAVAYDTKRKEILVPN